MLDLLTELRARSIHVTLSDDGEKLKISAPKGAMDEATKTTLAARKDEVLGFLREATAGRTPAPGTHRAAGR